MKKLVPNFAKDFAKSVINRSLAIAGWKLAPMQSVVLEDHWYDGRVDGVLSKHHPPAIEDREFRKAIEHLAKRESFNDLDKAVRGEAVMFRLHLASQLASLSRSIDGDLVEFGVFRGATAYCMLDATKADDSENTAALKSMYLYDTFAGIPDAGMTNREREVGLAGAYRQTSLDLVRECLSDHDDRLQFRPGLVPDTLDEPGPARIAMMHVDLNLAQPTLQAIEWAFPRWSPGGICLLDDYLWEGYEDQRAVVDDFFAQRHRTILALPTGQGLVLNIGD
ncbi:MAG: TylF/MycF/NovP-related O-methyltransferase [Rubripirellula sp.]